MKLVKFNISGDLAHFRKPFSNISRLTYLIPPRMTIAGLIAGILGKDRDSYYSTFSEDNFRMSVVPQVDFKTVRIPQNIVGTAKEDMITFNSRGSGPKLDVIDPTRNRKQRIFEYIVNPEYDIYISLDDEEIENEIYNRLDNKKFEYTPSLGLAKCICDINDVQYLETKDINDQTVKLNSPCTDSSSISDMNGHTIVNEKITKSFSMSEGSRGIPRRKSDSFISYTFDKNRRPLNVNLKTYDKDNIITKIPEDNNIVELY